MNPDKLIQDDKPPKSNSKLLHTILTYWDESVAVRNKLEHIWARDQKILKGIPIYDEDPNSKVRRRPKLRFRKVWSAAIRIVAALYQAFLSDKQKFTIKGFDQETDFIAAKVLENMTRWRLNWLFRRRDAFTKIVWALMECVSPGLSVIKVHWKYNEEQGIDEPALTNYPLEQVCLDWQAPTIQESRYVYLENYLTKEQMEELGYENLEDIKPISIPNTPLRSTRFADNVDPVQSKGSGETNYNNGAVGNAYPAPGEDNGDTLQDLLLARYRVLECFYKKNGKIYMGVVNPEGQVWLKKIKLSPYGSIYPVAVGTILLEPHKLVPESVISPLAGPQEDLNMTLNLRKDNQLLAMMGGWSIDKFGGVDTQSLSNLRPGFIVRRNPGQGVIDPLRLPDVTQTSYAEAQSSQTMIEEMMGIPPVKQGLSESSKTGVTQLNLQEANAKENLFIATAAQTLFQQIIYLLAYEIQIMETDENIFRVSNTSARKDLGIPENKRDNVFDLTFDMDVEVDVGLNEASRAIELQREFLFLERANQANQTMILMLKSGIRVPNPQIIDVSQGLKSIAKKLGIDSYKEYLVPVTPPPAEQQPGTGTLNQSVEGANAPQPNGSSGQDDFQKFLSQTYQQ